VSFGNKIQEADENQKYILELRDKVRSQEIELLNNSAPGNASFNGTHALSLSGRQSMVTSGASEVLVSNNKMSAAAGSGNIQLGVMPKQPGESWIFLFRADLQKAIDSHKCRNMTINETKEITSQLFDSKAIANTKSHKTSGGLPLETMEMHTYRVMEKKYGLRSLAAEHTGALLTAIQRYSSQDNDILLFMKVFSNEVEEEFREVQCELRRSIIDLFRVQLMSK
jgi:hypothetical protein